MLFVKGLRGICCFPESVGFEHGVEDDEQFAQAGDHDDLKRFPGRFETLGERLDDRIATSCGEGGHVQNATDRGSSAPDGTFAMKVPAVAIEGSQAGQGHDFLPVERAQFREFGQQRNAGDRTGAGNGLVMSPFPFHSSSDLRNPAISFSRDSICLSNRAVTF